MNSTAAREFTHLFGRPGVFQLRRDDETDSSPLADRWRAAPRLTATTVFSTGPTNAQMIALTEAGGAVKTTNLTEEYTLSDFTARYGENAVIMFVLRKGRLGVVTPDTELPAHGVSLIALVADPTA